MKNLYDKLLLLLAFLALLGGVLFYMLKIEGTPEEFAAPDSQKAAHPYDPVPIPDSTAEEASWPEPEHQPSGPDWLYDVFTPPKIYIDADGNFTAKPPVDPVTEPFGIYLTELKREPYRIQLQGFSGNPDKPEECLLFLFDEERQAPFSIRPGQTNEEFEVEVADFRNQRKVDKVQDSIAVTAIVTIINKRTGEEVVLNDEEWLMNSETLVVFRSNEDSSVNLELEVDPLDPVTKFATSTGEYILREINLEDLAVTVEKMPTELSDAKIRTLSISEPEPTREVAPEEESVSPADEELDFDFNL